MKLFVFLSAVALASCSPVAQDESVMRSVVGNFVNCVNSDLSLCLKENALKATERLGSVRKLKISEGITIFNNNAKEAKSLELSAEPEERKRQISERLWESTSDLLKNSELELSFAAPEDDEEESRAISEEGRGKKKESKKKIRMLLPLLILAKAKAIAIAVFSLAVIAASIFKIAVLAKIAFIAKVIAILKALLQRKQQEQDHGWASHPHHEEHGWEGGWSRSRNEGNNLAYSAYTS